MVLLWGWIPWQKVKNHLQQIQDVQIPWNGRKWHVVWRWSQKWKIQQFHAVCQDTAGISMAMLVYWRVSISSNQPTSGGHTLRKTNGWKPKHAPLEKGKTLTNKQFLGSMLVCRGVLINEWHGKLPRFMQRGRTNHPSNLSLFSFSCFFLSPLAARTWAHQTFLLWPVEAEQKTRNGWNNSFPNFQSTSLFLSKDPFKICPKRFRDFPEPILWPRDGIDTINHHKSYLQTRVENSRVLTAPS